jgi:acylphosphatase
MKEKIRAHIYASGKVQGVFYRENTRKKAEKLRVTGWVKNLADGRVEALFEGGKKEVEEMVDWARKGPFWAKIEALDVIWEDFLGEFKRFEVRYDL